MALQIQEKNAAIGAAVGAGLPVAANFFGLDIEDQMVSLANAVFEGDLGSASFAAGSMFMFTGGALVLSSWIGPLNGSMGMLAMGLGMGLWALGIESYNVGGGS